jgi:hypothetical protein
MMLAVDALMKIDVHSKITAKTLAPLMDKWYHDYRWDARQVGRMLRNIADNREKSGCPKWGKWDAFSVFRNNGFWEYSLYPARETYIWLAKIRLRLELLSRSIVRTERRQKSRAVFKPVFDGRCMWDPEWLGDTRDVPITDGIVFRQL